LAVTIGRWRRTAPTAGGGGPSRTLFTRFDYHPFFTDRPGHTLTPEADHRPMSYQRFSSRSPDRALQPGLPVGAARRAWATPNRVCG